MTDLGGAIDVTTQAGEGTTFEIWLPVAGETSMPAVETARALPHGNGETVMIVDDERPLVALAEEITAQLGYEPVGFDSSSAALQAFRAKPRAVRCGADRRSDARSRRHRARPARSGGCGPTMPIILMSGYGGAQLTNRAADIGVNEVLRKPLHRRDLAESLARALGSAH